MKRCTEAMKRNVYGKVMSRCTTCDAEIGTFASVNAAMEAFTTHVADVKAARKVTVS